MGFLLCQDGQLSVCMNMPEKVQQHHVRTTMPRQILVFILTMAALSNLPCAESHVLPGDDVTYITLEYRNGDMVEVDIGNREIKFTDKKEGAAIERSVNKASADQICQIKETLLKMVTSGLSKGLFTKESSNFIGATIGFNGPALKYLPRNDNVADEIGNYGKSLKAMLAK